MKRLVLLALCLAGLLARGAWSAPVRGNGLPQAPRIQVSISELPPLPGHDVSQATAISNRNVVVGNSQNGGKGDPPRAVTWTAAPVRALPLPAGADESRAFAVNDRGLIGGDSAAFDDTAHATLWMFNRPQLLAGFPNGGDSTVFGLNERGFAVGVAFNAGGAPRGAFWFNGRPIDMGTLPGMFDSIALAINNRNHSAGIAGGGRPTRAVFWNGTAIRALGELPGTSASEAYDLNDADQVVGFSLERSPSFRFRATLWDNGLPAELPTPAPEIESVATTINNTGLIGGQVVVQEEIHGALWVDGAFFDLAELIPPELGWELVIPRGSNDRGVLVGQGLHRGAARGFALAVRRL